MKKILSIVAAIAIVAAMGCTCFATAYTHYINGRFENKKGGLISNSKATTKVTAISGTANTKRTISLGAAVEMSWGDLGSMKYESGYQVTATANSDTKNSGKSYHMYNCNDKSGNIGGSCYLTKPNTYDLTIKN